MGDAINMTYAVNTLAVHLKCSLQMFKAVCTMACCTCADSDTSGCTEFPDHGEPAAPWSSMRNYRLSSPGPPKSTVITGGEESYAPSARLGPRGIACPVLSSTLRRVSINTVSRGGCVGSMRRREH